jgi:hypothetical protein
VSQIKEEVTVTERRAVGRPATLRGALSFHPWMVRVSHDRVGPQRDPDLR